MILLSYLYVLLNNFTSAHNKFYVSEKMPIYRNNILPAIGSKILCMLCAWSSLGSKAMHGVYHIQSGNMATIIDNKCSVPITHIT